MRKKRIAKGVHVYINKELYLTYMNVAISKRGAIVKHKRLALVIIGLSFGVHIQALSRPLLQLRMRCSGTIL